MKKIVKWVLVAIVAVVAIIGGVYYMSLPMKVTAVKAEPKTAEIYFIEQGIAGVERTAEVYAIVPGKILSLLVAENQSVKEGDVICVIDTKDIEFQIAQARSNIATYEAQINNLDIEEQKGRDTLISSKTALLGELKTLNAEEKSSSASTEDLLVNKEEQIRLQNIVIAQNEKDLERAKEELQKAETLYMSGIIPQSEYEITQNAVIAQENLLTQNMQKLNIIERGEVKSDGAYYLAAKESLEAQIKGIDDTLKKSYTGAMKSYYEALIEGSHTVIEQLNKKIEDAKVRANVSGVITELYIKDTNVANTQTPVAAITPDMTNLVEVYVSTNDIDEIQVGLEVDLILKRRAGDKTFTGVVKDIANEATVKLSVLGVEERRVKVTIAPVTGAEEIKKGFDVDVKFNTYFEQGKLAIPKTAFFVVDDKDVVWVIKDGKAIMTEVTKGRELRADFVVESGLSSGDYVITDADTEGLTDGANVVVE